MNIEKFNLLLPIKTLVFRELILYYYLFILCSEVISNFFFFFQKKRKRPKLFHKKNHVYHRTPQYIAALNRVLSQNNDTEDNSD